MTEPGPEPDFSEISKRAVASVRDALMICPLRRNDVVWVYFREKLQRARVRDVFVRMQGPLPNPLSMWTYSFTVQLQNTQGVWANAYQKIEIDHIREGYKRRKESMNATSHTD